MKLYVIRHGESVNNLKGLWTGWFDAELTEKGYDDAKRVRDIINGVRFDKIYSSDLIRAKKTAETALPNCTYETSPLLREISLGKLINTPIKSLSDQQKLTINNDGGYKSFGGENFLDLKKRIIEFRNKLEKSVYENVAVFCHGGWLKHFLFSVIGDIANGKTIQCNNCAIGIFEFNDEKWSLHSWINLN